MDEIPPGLYWFECPKWDGPSLVRVMNLDGKLVVSFRRGEMPTPFNRININATFTPSSVELSLMPFVQNRQAFYLEMVNFYEVRDLTFDMCILYCNKHLQHPEAEEAHAELHKLKAARGKKKS